MSTLQAYRDQQSHLHTWMELDDSIEQCECGSLRMKAERFAQCLPG